jgi:hypothetical protein
MLEHGPVARVRPLRSEGGPLIHRLPFQLQLRAPLGAVQSLSGHQYRVAYVSKR